MGLFNWQQKKIDNLIDNYFFGKSDDDVDYGEMLLEMGKPAAERLFLALKSGKYDSSGLWLDGFLLLNEICFKVGEENIIEEAFNIFCEELHIQDLLYLTSEAEGPLNFLTMTKLIEIGRSDIDLLIKEMDSDVESSRPIVIVNDPSVVDVRSSHGIRIEYFILLGQFKTSKVVDLLIKWFKDVSLSNWRDLIKVLVDIGSPTVLPLINLLFDSQKDIKTRAAFALGKIGDVRAIESLTFALQNDNSGYVKFRAAEALEKIGKPAVDSLINSLHHKDKLVRGYAAEALKDTKALNDLCILLKDHEQEVREKAGKAIQIICQKNNLSYEKIITDFQNRTMRGIIKEKADSSIHANTKTESMETLKKLKELLDMGAISEAEYQMKKSKLMKEI